ncbi:nephrin-like isoform X2 [Tachypleus tridentatus]|uniref:nephrin-like isoform X2 n=1 Tax=Tachypleus tridentatus TaxID=6853 RepID=UPI003FCF0AAE
MDIEFACFVDANPTETDVWWYFNDSILSPDMEDGIIVNNQTLSIRNIQTRHSGEYKCGATNQEGESWSEDKQVVVHHPPLCKTHKVQRITAAPGLDLNVTCEVEALPSDVTFHWNLNTTLGNASVKTSTSNQTTSVTTILVHDYNEYGMIYCWAENRVGRQIVPCKYKLVPGGLPEAPHSCATFNNTKYSVIVRCLPGFNEGLPQDFHVEVFTEGRKQLVTNISTPDTPYFYITSLPRGSSFFLVVYAANALGRSPYVTLQTATLGDKQVANSEASGIDSVQLQLTLGLILGVLVVLLILSATKAIEQHYRQNNKVILL